ncbi:MAG: D-alanyl-D-alanine dipeptidase [Phormidesmis sp. CAN_BIN36]|nr:D-alanyl-D-alanine dipeptidase [Phormidesmis sp. CAN_BIN36]
MYSTLIIKNKKIRNRLNFLLAMLISLVIVYQTHPYTQAIVPPQAKLVDIRSISPNVKLDIRYATKNNFTKQQLYRQARCLLMPKVADSLSKVQADLETRELSLKVYDCYRPLSVQKLMWKIVHDDRYVANPAKGSRHNRGSAVDVTLVDKFGKELEMPTGFDDFSDRAHRTYNNVSKAAKANRQTLEAAMVKYGFVPLEFEWWHFDAKDWEQSPLMDVSFEAIPN